ncbi:MAG: CvpA family protein [Sphaerochaetaceae bacterium]|jgi:membrane protein required for colicin V production
MESWFLAIGPYNFNIVDLIIIGIAFLAAVVGSVRGFAREFSSRAGFLIGIIIALYFAKNVQTLIIKNFDLPLIWSTLIAFLVLFAAGYLIIMIIGNLLEKTLDALGLKWLDRFLGLVLGVVELLIVVGLVVYLLNLQSVVNLRPYLDNSVIVKHLVNPLTTKSTTLIKGRF